MEIRTKQFESIHRAILIAQSLLAGYIALGGDIGLRELGLVLACLGMNEMRVRLHLERSGIFMTLFWTGLFFAAPMLYLDGEGFGTHLLSGLKLNETMLRGLVVALAFPFQSFASYLSSMPRAQHLVHAFVLVEAVLGIQQGEGKTLWPLLLVLIALLSVSMLLSAASHAALEQARLDGEAPAKSPLSSLLRLRRLPSLLLPALLTCALCIGLYVVLPRFNTDRAISFMWSEAEGELSPGDLAPGAMPERKPRTDINRSRGMAGYDELMSDASRALSLVGGLAEGVNLDRSAGPIYKNDTEIATAVIYAVDPEGRRQIDLPPLLKAYTLETFDGVRWSGGKHIELPPPTLGTSLAEYQGAGSRSISPKLLLDLNWVEPETTDYSAKSVQRLIFSPGAIEEIIAVKDANGRSPTDLSIHFDPALMKFNLVPRGGGIGSIQVVARPLDGSRQLPRSAQIELGQDEVDRLTYLPQPLKARLHADWSKGAELQESREEAYIKARSLERWFQNNGQYSLDQRPLGDGALGDFICDREKRTGHCEYYATGMAVGLRHLGIPARLATGLAARERTGNSDDQNEGPTRARRSSTWTLRASSAHAWVEAYFPDRGWVSFDPTPGSSELLDNPLSNRLNPAEAKLPEEKVELDASGESSATNEGEDEGEAEALSFEAWRASVMQWLDSTISSIGATFANLFEGVGLPRPNGWMQGLIIVVLAIALGIGARFMWLMSKGKAAVVGRAKLSRSEVQARAESLYTKLEQCLIGCGFTRPASNTPLEFARKVSKATSNALASAVDATVVYYDLRYRLGANRETLNLAREDLDRLEHLISRVEAEALQWRRSKEEKSAAPVHPSQRKPSI